MMHPTSRLAALAAGAALQLASTPSWAGAQHVVLAPHRAIYEMTLAEARGGAGVTAVSGRMVYEPTGSGLRGLHAEHAVRHADDESEGLPQTLTDLRSSSWEEGSGKRFRFNSSQFRDEKPTEATAGDAARANAADAAKVELTKPATKHLALPQRVYFPIQHSIALLDAAHYGQAPLPRRPLRRLRKGREGLRHHLGDRPDDPRRR